MSDGYAVSGGVGDPVFPGTVAPDAFDGRAEWLPPPGARSLLELVDARLGSEDDVRRTLLAVLAPLRAALDGEPLEAILRHLPGALAREIADADLNLNARVRTPTGTGDYLAEVSRLVLQPPWRAATAIRAVFAAARAVLSPEETRAVEARLPPDLAGPWSSAD
jgi:uncharacterized protein (DUF2267 family)